MQYCFLYITILVFLLMPNCLLARDYDELREACEPIRDQIEEILANSGLSPDYFMLAAAESHCKIDRVSKHGAVGVWQMMPRTAKKYGCDDPLDIECSTRAAARYLKHLEEVCGEKNVILCWHDGGTNFKKKGATKAAKGLQWQVEKYIKTDFRL